MAANYDKHITLNFNCGYARVAVRELTPKGRWKSATYLTERALKFRDLFGTNEKYGVQPSYFEANDKKQSQFDQDCEKIVQIWSKRWNPSSARQEYETTFAIQKWKKLSMEQKEQHTLQKCKACQKRHQELQLNFPVGPYFNRPSIISVNKEALENISKKEATRQALAEINTSFSEEFETSFTDSLVSCGNAGVQKKPTRGENKKQLRQVYRKFRDQENQALQQAAAIAVLTEDESIRAYTRKRKRQYFEPTPPAKRPKPVKSHSPNFDNVTWDKDKLLQDLQSLPTAPPPLNWQQFAREHGIPGNNAGQVAKDFARKSGVDTERLDGKPGTSERQRVRRRRLIGGEISVPSTPTPETIKTEWKKLVESGEISLGRPCVPFNMIRFTTKDGELEKKELTIVGRKFPLLEIRKDLLSKHEKYMRLTSDKEIEEMSLCDLRSLVAQFDHKITSDTVSELQSAIKRFQRTRSLIMWHDHGTILGLGCIILTAHVVYDPAVFYTQAEYEAKHGKCPSIQSLVERPVIHLMAAGSSSVEDQLTLLQERLDCLDDLSTTITSTSNIAITDTLKFFIGDHPAQQFECGTQHGGNFKCCGCGIHSNMMGDLAHTLQLPWRSLSDQQELVIKGKFGKQASNSKPFDSLRVAELRQELHARGIYDTDHCKDDLQKMLSNILQGIQRVPTLLLLNPIQPLSQVHLNNYTILNCEPLHDLKGHFRNLIQELPFLLKGDNRTACEEVITAISGDTMTGAKCRVCLIELFLCLRKLSINSDILLLVESAVHISATLYMDEEHRNSRNILRLYNLTWLHHELCNTLITTFHGGMRYTTFFGTYLHALVVHAPQQLEIVSLRSVNTENHERLFEQARRAATAASNRHPQNVLYTAVMRLQAKAAFKSTTDSQLQADSIVARAGADLPKYSGTFVSQQFIHQRERSWQGHLKRISHYLLHGKGVWWRETGGGYQFFDGDDDPIAHPEGPHLRHFRSVTLKEVTTSSLSVWDQVVAAKIELPTSGIMLYDGSGEPVNRVQDYVDKTSRGGDELSQSEGAEDTDSTTEHTEFDNTGMNLNEEHHEDEQLDQQENQTSEVHVAEEEEKGLKTKHATEIEKIIGSSTELTQFDDLRYRLKSTKKISDREKIIYKKLFYKLQLAVQRKRTELLEQMRLIEQDYHNIHGNLPHQDNCPEYAALMLNCKHINKLLQAWNIS